MTPEETLDWLAQQHFDQCREERPIQDWIRKMKVRLPAQPEQEPVAYGMWDTMIGYGGRMMSVRLDKGQDGCTVPLYITPPQRTWVGLTDEDLAVCGDEDDVMLARYWERVCKEKNT